MDKKLSLAETVQKNPALYRERCPGEPGGARGSPEHPRLGQRGGACAVSTAGSEGTALPGGDCGCSVGRAELGSEEKR